ncbi:MAG: hypothetical protein HZB41_07410 [Ignavibacteriae bacterium]|nr:hypothetical protein [Ignavibacteriota bacterium]
MTDLKEFNKFIIKEFKKEKDIDLKAVDNYPSNIFYECEINNIFQNYIIGIGLQYHSTGSRLSYKDYSGQYATDFLNEALMFSIYYHKKSIVLFNYFEIRPLISYNLLLSYLEIIEKNQIYNNMIQNKMKTHATSHSISVGADLNKNIYGLKMGIRISYLIDLNYFAPFLGGEYYIDNTEYYLSVDKKTIKSQWGGLKIALTMEI